MSHTAEGNAVIRLRGYPSSVWAEHDYVLEEREPAFDTDLRRMKIGDGVSAWSVLPWAIDPSPTTPADVDQRIDTARDLPAYAGVRHNPYNPQLNLYNWKASNTHNIHAGLGKALAGEARTNLTFIGDSLTDGKVTTTPATFDRLNSWPLVMRDLLGATHAIPTGGDGMVRAAAPGGLQDPRVVVAGGWTQSNGAYAYVSASGATITWTFAEPSTTVDIWYSVNSGPFTVSMDGAASGPGYASVIPAGGATWARVTLTGALGLHVVVLTTTSAAATNIANANSYADSGLVVQNCASSGSAILDWVTYTLWYQLAGIVEVTQTPYARDGVFIGLGANDIQLHGRTPTQMKTDMGTLIDRWDVASTGDIVLVVTSQVATGSVPNALWDEWAGYLYDLADDYDIPLIDAYARFGSNATMAADGLLGDGSHLNAAGYRAWGRQAANVVGS